MDNPEAIELYDANMNDGKDTLIAVLKEEIAKLKERIKVLEKMVKQLEDVRSKL